MSKKTKDFIVNKCLWVQALDEKLPSFASREGQESGSGERQAQWFGWTTGSLSGMRQSSASWYIQ